MPKRMMLKFGAGFPRPGARPFLAGAASLAVACVLSGCHVDMWRQPKAKANMESDFFSDRQVSRPLVPGTVPVGGLDMADPYHTGRAGAAGERWVSTIPSEAVLSFASPKVMLLRGRDRYDAFCSPCHGNLGDGNGMITQRGLQYWQKIPASYHTDRLRRAEDGYLYDVLVNGKGVMYGYASRIQDINDRWAVVAYIRALQLAQKGLPPAEAEALTARWKATQEAAGAEAGEHHGDADDLNRKEENAAHGTGQPEGELSSGGQDGGHPNAGPDHGRGGE
jgi:hypothetical protein